MAEGHDRTEDRPVLPPPPPQLADQERQAREAEEAAASKEADRQAKLAERAQARQDKQAAKEAKAAQKEADRAKAAEKAAAERAQAEKQAEKDRAAREKVAQEKAAREQAAREQETRDSAEHTSELATTQAAPQAAPQAGRSGRAAAPVRRTRKAQLRLVQVDAWSVMKTSFLLSIALGIVLVVAVAIVWAVLGAAGVWDSINSIVQQAVGSEDGPQFDITDYVGTSRIIGFAMIVAVVDVVLITAIATLGAFLYNLSAALLGGVEVTLAEDN